MAVRAARLFDVKTGAILTNQVVLIRGDRIADVGSAVAVPSGATVIDLGSATLLPGLIDAHVHTYGPGSDPHERAIAAVANAQKDLQAGFTTVMDMDSRGGYGTVDLRNAINAGVIDGPRMQVVGQSLNQRASGAYDADSPTFADTFTENKNLNSPWLARAAVREAKLHGVDWVKIYTTQDFVGEEYHVWKPDGSLVNSPSLTLEEVQAVVDEAHRLGLKVACHTYGGEGQLSCLKAGVDAPNHLTDLDDESLALLVQKKLPFVLTIDDLLSLEPGDLQSDRRQEQPSSDGGAEREKSDGRRRADHIRQRRDQRQHSSRHAGQSVRRAGEVGHDPGQGAADLAHRVGESPQLQLGGPRRQHRERQVRRPHRRFGEPADRHQRNGTREICDEGWRYGSKRSACRAAFVDRTIVSELKIEWGGCTRAIRSIVVGIWHRSGGGPFAQTPQAPWRGAGPTPCIGTDGGVYKCAPPPRSIAVRAGRLFDSATGRMLTNQTILMTGDRITAVGPANTVSVPQGASVIDLSRATVLPGLIDAHTHMFNTRAAGHVHREGDAHRGAERAG